MEMIVKFVLIFGLFVQTSRQEGCRINNFIVSDSVILSTDFSPIYPSIENSPDDRNVTIPPGATIIISCKGGHFSKDIYKTTRTILATCNQDSQLEAQDQIVDFDALQCVNFSPVVTRVTPEGCAPDSRIIEVGFQIGLNIQFVPQIRICFDYEKLIPVYSNYNLSKSIGFIKSYLTTQYEPDGFYGGANLDDLYNNVTAQEEKINKLLGLPLESSRYVDPVTCHPFSSGPTTPGFCFSRRPLAYRGNFVYTVQHYSTYKYINVAPQWYFLDYNLDKLEDNVIDFVKKNKIDLEVFSGTFGVATLAHATTGEQVELFLLNGTLAVPLIFWKLIYDSISFRATVFFTINDPHLDEDDISKNVLCEDISDEIKWLTWEKHNATKGYSYACRYDDAREAISYLPDIPVKGLLV